MGRVAWQGGAGAFAALLAAAFAIAALAPALAQGGGGPVGVHVDMVRKMPLTRSAPVLGRLVATRSGEVAARIGAPVESYVVEVGDRVARGDPIVLLDDSILSARVAQARGALAEADARVSIRRERLALAEQRLSRLDRLRESAAFSQANYEDQRQEVAIARAEVGAAEAAVQRAQADLQAARIDLRHAEVVAPYAGVITGRMLEAGAYADPGTPLVAMVSDDALEVEVNVASGRLAALRVGDRLDIELGDGTTHVAKVRAILPHEDPLTRTRPIRLVPSFGETEVPLASGQSATVSVPLGSSREVLTVDKDAVLRQGGQASVFVHADGAAEVRPVQLGEAVDGRFEVVDGLEAGELAVVRGNERLQPGQPLRIERRLGPSGGADDGSGDSAQPQAGEDDRPGNRQEAARP